MKQSQPHWRLRLRLFTTATAGFAMLLAFFQFADASELRRSAIVQAVAGARSSVVSIHGHKTIPNASASNPASTGGRRVNGMGTGVVVDPRGYIVTNHHVVENVGQINVNLDNGRSYVARMIAHDPYTDLAIIKIPTRHELPLIKIGKSHDLMTGEEVVAVGNAYGYEQTVTRGIVSALHRTVKVNDEQKYYDLIQTDASINPGNSGGPLLNIDGEMIGINVAVRVGAQGIGFAIPVDKAMEVAAQLLSKERAGVWHGVITGSQSGSQGLLAERIQDGSPAAVAGIQAGDVISLVNDIPVDRALDLERALIGTNAGEQISFLVNRNGEELPIRLELARRGRKQRASNQVDSAVFDLAWSRFGMQLIEIPPQKFERGSSQFKGGLKIVTVRAGSPAARQGVRSGDILVGLHKWETASASDLSYVMKQPKVLQNQSVKFFIMRNEETLFGHLPATQRR